MVLALIRFCLSSAGQVRRQAHSHPSRRWVPLSFWHMGRVIVAFLPYDVLQDLEPDVDTQSTDADIVAAFDAHVEVIIAAALRRWLEQPTLRDNEGRLVLCSGGLR